MPANTNNRIVSAATVVALTLLILIAGAAIDAVGVEVFTVVHDGIERNALKNGTPLR